MSAWRLGEVVSHARRSERSADLTSDVSVFVHASPHSGSEVLSCYRGRTLICNCRRGRPRRGRSGPEAGCLRKAAVLRTACPTACRGTGIWPGLVFVASQDEGLTGLAWRNIPHIVGNASTVDIQKCFFPKINTNVFAHASPHSGSEVLSCYRGRTCSGNAVWHFCSGLDSSITEKPWVVSLVCH